MADYSPGVTSDLCADCGHKWSHHPGAALLVEACVSCIEEQDYGKRDEADMCVRVTPGTDGLPAGHWLTARHLHRRFRGGRVRVEARQGYLWATLRPPAQSPEDIQALLRRVQEDLGVLTLDQFDEKYRALEE